MADLTIKQYDQKIHNIYLKGDVDEDMWQVFVDKVNEIKSADEEIDINNAGTLALIGISVTPVRPPINIYLSTYGGVIYDMFSIYDEIKQLTGEYEVFIHCVGKIMSAGTIIMLAVDLDHRIAYSNTTFMFHSLSGFSYGKMKDMEENLEESKRLHKMMWKIYKENTSIPEDKLEEVYKCKKDWFLSADQAKKYKIISKVI